MRRFCGVMAGVWMLAATVPASAQSVLYVKADASGANDGTSWVNAYVHLQSALAAASAGQQIWVAAATYMPDGGRTLVGGAHISGSGDQSTSFHLASGVSIFGGFSGDETILSHRSVQINVTTLSGDLNGDDGPGFSNRADNANNVVTANGVDSTAIIDGFRITAGHSTAITPEGGGLSTQPPQGNPSWSNSLGTPTVLNCTFAGNYSTFGSGAVHVTGPATFIGCRFFDNQGVSGGALIAARYPDDTTGVSATMVNCLFTGNTATCCGGAVLAIGNARIINCTIANNTCSGSDGGGGVFVARSGLLIQNSVLWGNIAATGSQLFLGHLVNASVGYSDLQFGTAGVGLNDSSSSLIALPGIIDEDPLFTDSANNDFTLGRTSPCIDAGDSAVLPADQYDINDNGNRLEPVPLDLAGNVRRIEVASRPATGLGPAPIVDMGCYETRTDRYIVFDSPVGVPEGRIKSEGVHLAWDPASPVTVTTAFDSGDSDISVVAGAALEFDSTNFSAPQQLVLSAAPDADALDGTTVFRVSATGFPTALLTARELDREGGVIVHVRADASSNSSQDGLTWQTAYSSLQDALDLARIANGFYSQIWVAAGTYRPDNGAGYTRLDRNASFNLIPGVAIYGGFVGGESQLAQRNARANRTILSGDLNGDDGPAFSNFSDNSEHVVTAINGSYSAILDGFVIRHGFSNSNGAGLYATLSAPSGNGVTCSPVDCDFVENWAANGGAIYAVNGLLPTNCRFYGNRASHSGGAIQGSYVSPINCLFDANFAEGASPDGGGAVDGLQQMDIYNSTFIFNSAAGCGGGVRFAVNGAVRNCILWSNSAGDCGSQLCSADSYTLNVYSDIQDVHSGGTCHRGAGALTDFPAAPLSADPRFVNANGADNVPGTEDDDLHLSSGSPCIDAGEVGDIQAGFDLDGNARLWDDPATPNTGSGTPDYLDMGAFEFGSGPVSPRIYVSAGATGAANGSSWGNAFTDFVLAQRTALASGGRINEIWVARGTYFPGGRNQFRLTNGVALFGGFAGSESALGERTLTNPSNETVLSGDQHNDDLPNYGNRGDNSYQVVTCDGTNSAAVLDGFTIRGGYADASNPTELAEELDRGAGIFFGSGRATLRNIKLVDNLGVGQGGAFYGDLAQPSLDSFSIGPNSSPTGDAGVFSRSSVNLTGALTLTGGTAVAQTLDLRSTQFDGPGGIRIGPNVVVRISSAPSYDPVIFRSPVSAIGGTSVPAAIQIDQGQRLVLDGGAVIDLSGLPAGPTCADPSQSSGWGVITVNGELVVNNATVQNTRVGVNVGSLGSTTNIINNDLKLLQSSTGFGGQFFVAPGATVRCNVITSEGDRYLDLDPDPSAPQRPVVQDNKFYVVIKQGTAGSQGELLELRSRDADNGVGAGQSGAYSLASSAGDAASAGYSDTWALERLTVNPNAKCTLTNRQGFDFQPASSVPEALYVKDLVLGTNALLNTGLQRMYYQTLHDEFGGTLTVNPNDPHAPLANGSHIVDVPLLGFSLGNIACDDDTEFSVRVRTRLRDVADVQPSAPPFKEGSVLRITGAIPSQPANGVMQIKTQAAGALSATSVAAKGAFARAGEDQIVVAFRYLFCNNLASELVVSISDQADLGVSNVEVARIHPPTAGLSGSIGSSTMADFFLTVPRGSLNFTRGTYIELELRGTDACCLIDDFDPYVRCSFTCNDLNGDNGVSNADYQYVLGELGQTLSIAGPSRWCVDSKFNDDHYIDAGDVNAWDTYAAVGTLSNPLNLCGNDRTVGAGSPVAFVAGSSPTLPGVTALIIAGKPAGTDAFGQRQQDYLYSLDATSGTAIGTPQPPADGPLDAMQHRGNRRLIGDSAGGLYQINGLQGIIRLSDAQPVVRPGVSAGPAGTTVYVGLTAFDNGQSVGVPIADAAFHPSDLTALYVVPVLVKPADNGPAYRAAAKLRLAGGDWSVERLYGLDPRSDPLANATPPTSSVVNVQRQREIEVDASGSLYVLSACPDSGGNNWLLLYDEAVGTGSEVRVPLAGGLAAANPSSMLVAGDKLYVAADIADPANPGPGTVRRFSITRGAGNHATGLTSSPSDGSITLTGMTHVTALAAHPTSGAIWAIGFTPPAYSGTTTFGENDNLATLPMRAVIPGNATLPATIGATALSAFDLALPVAAIFTGGGAPCLRGDVNDDGQRNAGDVAMFVGVLLNGTTDADLRCRADLNADNAVDGADIGLFVRCVLGAGCP